MRYAFVMVAFLALPTCVTTQPDRDCVQTRAAFDIGSGGTRMKVAKVDLCKHKLLKLFLEQEEKVGYKDDLESNQTGAFSPDIQAKGMDILKKMRAAAAAFAPDAYIGGATSAFREASNGEAFAREITSQTGIETRILTAKEEGILGFLGVIATTSIPASQVVVWDIGGGSKQFTALGPNAKTFRVFSDGYASIAFKNAVIGQVLGRDPAKTDSPNPIGEENITAAAALVKANAKSIPAYFNRLLANPETNVIGIGGVHYYSVRGQTVGKEKTYSRAEVKRAMTERVTWGDDKIGGDYADTDVTNLILVHSYMDALAIERVRTTKVNMADGLLLWRPERL